MKETGERFIYSINHFKAKSGSGTGANADQGDGQGMFNATRKGEANSVIDAYETERIGAYANDKDILIMGDLNAYAKEDPIRVFTDYGMTDLHRYFHGDSSYSYVYGSLAGYLDHAIVSAEMLPQVTGMTVWHINSDERDCYTYDGYCNDGSIFRCSDHDPVLVGLRLQSSTTTKDEIILKGNTYYRIYDTMGMLLLEGEADENTKVNDIFAKADDGVHGIRIVQIFTNNRVYSKTIIIP